MSAGSAGADAGVDSLDEIRTTIIRQDTLRRASAIARAAVVGSVVAAGAVGALVGLVWLLPVPITAGSPAVVALAFALSWSAMAVIATAAVATR